ncbi:MAG: hypothetical protein K6F60_03315 [Eubacterium sp.]|nr:hypothetical protein [Eubacterium sp.]
MASKKRKKKEREKKYSGFDIARFVILGTNLVVEGVSLVFFSAYTKYLVDTYEKYYQMGYEIGVAGIVISALFVAATITGLVMTKLKKHGVLFTELLLKIGLFCIFIAVVVSGEDTGHSPRNAFIIIGALSILFAVWAFSISFRNVKNQVVTTKGPFKYFDKFDIDQLYKKAEEEYLYLYEKNKEELVEEDKIRIYDNAANEITYFITWLIRRGLIAGKLRKKISEETIEAFNNKTVNPTLFVRNELDFSLTRDDINKNVLFFIDSYLGMPKQKSFVFSHKARAKYFFDYYMYVVPKNEKGQPLRYTFDFSWETYEKLEKVINERYEDALLIESEGRSSTSHDKGSIYSNVFNTEIKVKAIGNVTDEYTERCKAAFDDYSSKLSEELLKEAFKVVKKDVPIEKDYLRGNITPSFMNIFEPKNPEEVAFSVFAAVTDRDNTLLNAFNEKKISNGEEPTTMLQVFIGWIIRNEVLVAVYPIDKECNPWDFERDLSYRKKIVGQFEMVEKQLTVEGMNDPKTEEIAVPSCMVDLIDYYISMMEAMIAEGLADSYKVRPECKSMSDDPYKLVFEARKKDAYDRIVFKDELLICSLRQYSCNSRHIKN